VIPIEAEAQVGGDASDRSHREYNSRAGSDWPSYLSLAWLSAVSIARAQQLRLPQRRRRRQRSPRRRRRQRSPRRRRRHRRAHRKVLLPFRRRFLPLPRPHRRLHDHQRRFLRHLRLRRATHSLAKRSALCQVSSVAKLTTASRVLTGTARRSFVRTKTAGGGYWHRATPLVSSSVTRSAGMSPLRSLCIVG
jgi:hypothetical protein